MFTVYNDRFSTFEQFVHKEDSVSVHIRNFQDLATAIYKAKKKKDFSYFGAKYSQIHWPIMQSLKTQNFWIETYLESKIIML